MKDIKIYCHSILIGLLLILLQTGASHAYYVDWTAIRYQTHEESGTINKLSFDVRTDGGDWITDRNIVTGVTLRDPSNNIVSIGTVEFSSYDYLPAGFDKGTSSWLYNSNMPLTDFSAPINQDLVIGVYTLEVTTNNGQTLTKNINFEFKLKLPYISSRSFQIHQDSSGNLFWTWEIPQKLLSLAGSYDLVVKAGIGVYTNTHTPGDTYTLFWPNIPVEMGHLYVPNSVFQQIINGKDKISFSFQVRTTNNNARGYSKRIEINDLTNPISVLPKKNVVVVPLN